jgi:hypothetical protein
VAALRYGLPAQGSRCIVRTNNQVPATWFVSEAGIRRLASHSDGPERGRRRFFPTGVFLGSVLVRRSCELRGAA